MLPKKERLSRQEFNRFFSLGKRSHSPHVTLMYTKYESLHVSVVVSKKVSGSAVVRNKVRRRVYESVRMHAREHGTMGVFIFIVKKGTDALPFGELTDEVKKLLSPLTR